MTTDILVREPSKQVEKNHSAFDIIGELEADVQTRGNSKVNYREMIWHMCYTLKTEPKNVYWLTTV